MATFLDQTQQNPAALPLVLGHFLFAIGIILWRSGFGYRWAGVAIAIGVLIDIVGGMTGLPDVLVSVASDGIFCTGLAAVGLNVLLTSDTEWEANPAGVRTDTGHAVSVAHA